MDFKCKINIWFDYYCVELFKYYIVISICLKIDENITFKHIESSLKVIL